MNELLAESRFTLTKELFEEGMRRVWAENTGKSMRRLLLILALVWLALLAYTLIRGGSLALPLTELAVLALVALWATVWLPRGRIRRAWNAFEAQGRADTERVTGFYSDRLEVDGPGTLTRVPYSDVTRILQSKNLIIILSGDQTGVLVKRDSFTQGSAEEALRLIERVKEDVSHD